jgi:6-pyruvoyltetrahydropterin/6-carboxytetrahydropterin synthase
MSWLLRKTFGFEASHQLPLHDGPCAHLHGHSYRLTVEVCGVTLHTTGPKTGMVVDYGDISAAVKPLLVQALDHHDLNTSLPVETTTAEMIAQWVYDQLAPVLPGLVAVVIGETASTEARYEP